MPSTANAIEFASHAKVLNEGRKQDMNPAASFSPSTDPLRDSLSLERRTTSSCRKPEKTDFQQRLIEPKRPSTLSGRLRLRML
ncbi:MAG: hypothetical protein ABIH86_01260 [Planctomycetota bacterium]